MLGLILDIINITKIEGVKLYSVLDPVTMLAVAAGGQALLGAGQAIFSGRKKAGKEPVYEIPKEVQQGINLATGMAQEGMPEAQRTAAIQNVQQSALMSMRGAADRRSGLSALGNIQAQQDRSALNIMAQDAAMRMQNQRFLYSALMSGANAADKAFANRWQSWANKMQQSRANVGAGMQNMAGSLKTLATGAIYGVGGDATLTPGKIKKIGFKSGKAIGAITRRSMGR